MGGDPAAERKGVGQRGRRVRLLLLTNLLELIEEVDQRVDVGFLKLGGIVDLNRGIVDGIEAILQARQPLGDLTAFSADLDRR